MHLRGLVLWAALAVPTGAAAAEETHQYPECNREPSDSDLTAAKAAFQAGNVSFNEADYPRALLYWEDAFRRDCTAHPLLLNLARAYELGGQKRQAVIALETFLQREPNSPERAQISRRIEVLKKQIEAEPPPVAATATAQPAADAPPEPPPSSAPHEPAPSRGPSTTMKVLPWVVVGAGGVMTLTGTLVYSKAHQEVNDYKELCGGTENCPPGQEVPANEAAKRETIGSVVAISGLVVLGGGLLWYALTPKSPRTAITPVAYPGYAGLAVDGRF
ncbi:MAG TPA: tetratricopeptide repeat protein [Polyangiaceae bacterium]